MPSHETIRAMQAKKHFAYFVKHDQQGMRAKHLTQRKFIFLMWSFRCSCRRNFLNSISSRKGRGEVATKWASHREILRGAHLIGKASLVLTPFLISRKLWTPTPEVTLSLLVGIFWSDYDNDYKYEFFNVYPLRMREALTSTRTVVKISSPSWRELRDFQQISSPDLRVHCRFKGELKG